MGTFIIKTRTDGSFQFNLKAGNGEIILTSQGYTSKQGCENGIASVKTNATIDRHYHRCEAKDGSPYFNLVAGNGEIIGTSQMYSSNSSRDHGIESVKANAPGAKIIEE
jgi:uncharacterized protein YegP (UPF0339 family)